MKTVRVPAEMEPLFQSAEALVSRYFSAWKAEPERGTIEVFGERYVLVRAASLSVEFFSMVGDLFGAGRELEAEDFTRNILFDLAHAIGKSDAKNFHARMNVSDPIGKLSAGPVHFAYTGWASVDISAESNPVPGPDFFLVYEHPASFEADAWLEKGKKREFPACIMNAGYSSGWCEESFGSKLVASEILCRARGDECCRFLMAQPDRIESHLQRYLEQRKELKGRVSGYQIPDFFARKRMEEELRRARDELEKRVLERTEELRRANDLLRLEIAGRETIEKQLRQSQKLEALGRLSGGIAHDFNNLMGVVIGHSSLLERRVPAGDPLHIHLEEITKAGRRAAALTQQLLAFARAHVPKREVLELNQIIGDLGKMLSRVIGENIELALSLGDGTGQVEADRGQIEQVVMNLVVNARDAMATGGTLRVDTSRVIVDGKHALAAELLPGSYAVITVSDTGVGMDEELVSKIFDPFFTTKGDRGTGLGLSTVYGIVKSSGGAVEVTSAPGKGSRFRVYLPRTEGQSVRRMRAASLVPAPDHAVVLLVEDQLGLLAIASELLRSFGCEVLEASTPEEALRIADTHVGTIDLLLTDVLMPRKSGRQVAQEVIQKRPTMRVLYMSGFTDDDDLREEVERGAALLHKPFTAEELEHAVHLALSRA